MQGRDDSSVLFLQIIEVLDRLTGAGLADADAVRLEIAARVLADGHATKVAGANDNDIRLGCNDIGQICDGQLMTLLSPPTSNLTRPDRSEPVRHIAGEGTCLLKASLHHTHQDERQLEDQDEHNGELEELTPREGGLLDREPVHVA